MKSMYKKIFSMIMAFALIIGLVSNFSLLTKTANAANETDVVIHKIKLNDITGWPKDTGLDNQKYNGTQINNITSYFGAGSEELAGVTFTYWNVKDKAKYDQMVAAPQNFDTVEKVQAHLNQADQLDTNATVVGQGVKVQNLAAGNYWFVENKGSNITGNTNLAGHTLAKAAAVPFGLVLPMAKADGTMFGTGDNALHVYPKNTVVKPKIDKDFASSLGGAVNADNPRADKETKLKDLTVGMEVPYEVQTKIPSGAEYKTASWSDRMTEGLTFKTGSVVVKVGSETLAKTTHYTLTETTNGFDLKFTDAGLEKINKKDAEQTVMITYSATLNKEAIVDIPESNDVTFHYGNNPTSPTPGKEPNTPEPGKPNPKDKSITVTKSWDKNVMPANWSVTVTLYNAQTGQKVQDSQTLNKSKTTHKWTGLDKDTEYKVVETEANGYAAHYDKPVNGTFAITNVKTDNPEPLKPTEPKVVTGGKRFQKIDETTKTGLQGAVFYVKNEAGDKYLAKKTAEEAAQDQNAYVAAEKAYKDAVKNSATDVATKKAARDAEFVKTKTEWKWQTEAAGAYEVTSGTDGYFKVTGLAYGNYKLEEKSAPDGYARLTAPIAFTVAKGSYEAATYANTTMTDAGQQLVNNRKVTIPQTGGIGTIIFTIVGASVMAGAVLAMRRRKTNE